MNDIRVADSFWLSEFLVSQTAARKGISNEPTPEHRANILYVLGPGMQRVRNLLGVPVNISSGYRSAKVNAAVGGAKKSQHLEGLAADFVAPEFGTPKKICQYLMERSREIGFDQLIYEGTWAHISFVANSPRSQVLTAHFGGGATRYTEGLA